MGPDFQLENRPWQIMYALGLGFHCEVDVWYVKSKWYLGHDGPSYEVPYEFLETPNLWIHAKNLGALYVLSANRSLNFFWHQNDDFTLTSQGDIWTYPGKPLTRDSIMVMPEWEDATLANTVGVKCLGICSDFVLPIKNLRNVAK